MVQGNVLVAPQVFVRTRDGREAKEDKNGLKPIILTPVAGKIPNKMVLTGTVAQNLGIEVGKTYLLSYRERSEDQIPEAARQYGRAFVYTKLAELSALEILQATEMLGPAQVIDVTGKTPVIQEPHEVIPEEFGV